jgi:hypothetical protein
MKGAAMEPILPGMPSLLPGWPHLAMEQAKESATERMTVGKSSLV